MVQISENSLKVLQSRYLLRDERGKLAETPDALFRRVAHNVASAELKWESKPGEWEEHFYRVMSELQFLPNSPALMNAGSASNQLSACFVLPVNDNLNSIFDTLKYAALIQQSGGGTGFNFSLLRPNGDLVSATGGNASGPVSFMKIFDAATEYVKQGGKRRGANMAILNIEHPDIEEFIDAKRQDGVLNNFNISVGISDAFMNAVECNGDWELIHPNSQKLVKKIRARKLWDKIVESAWLSGDPGLIFTDTINRSQPTPALGRIESTNPCGEVPLLPYESCNLGSVNLSKFIRQNDQSHEVDWRKLEEVIKIAVRFLDNVIEVNQYLIPEIRSMTMGNRKIGLGVMGWADLLILLEIPYDSDRAIQLAEQLMQFIQSKALEASIDLARERTVFPNWVNSIYYPDRPVRHATRTSIAPTGSISIIADCSASIEPLFALAFQRHHVLNDETLSAMNPYFINYLKSHKLYSRQVVDQLIKEGMAGQIEGLPEEARNIFKTALEIAPIWHLRHQVAFQKYTDNAVSKTINLPETATIKEVDEIYKDAWLLKAKGVTIFRYNSKGRQVMQSGIQAYGKPCKVCIG